VAAHEQEPHKEKVKRRIGEDSDDRQGNDSVKSSQDCFADWGGKRVFYERGGRAIKVGGGKQKS